MKTVFTAVKKVLKGGLLSVGKHLTTITDIVEDVATASANWADLTPQIKVVFKNASGTITQWFNMKGYKSIADFPTGIAPKGFEFRSSENGNENYLVNIKTNKRVESDEKTAQAMKIFGEFACDAGIAEGEDFGIADVIGKEIGVAVRDNNRGGVEVHYTMPASRVKVSEDAEA